MKSLELPYIDGLENMDTEQFALAMERGAAKDAIASAAWKEYPYKPDCWFSVARSRTHLAVEFRVRGLDLRSVELRDNGHSWEDSCCEFFIAHPSDGTYYNFEMTCAGFLLAAKRKSREDSVLLESSALKRVLRHASLSPEARDIKGGIFSWSIAMLIPFDLIGMDGDDLPKVIRANFYKCGDMTATPHYVSWSPVGTPSPDFHRPEYFGELVTK
jgi:hypothetical protein